MQRWEYLTIGIVQKNWADSLGRSGTLPGLGKLMSGNPTELLNELGEQGWELAGVDYPDGYSRKLFLKRPRQ